MPDDKKPFIFIDTCSLLDSCWNSSKGDRDRYEYSKSKDDLFWGHEFASLAAMGDVIIPKRNYDELVKHSKKTNNPDLASRSKHVLTRVENLFRQGTLQIIGDSNDPFADALLLSVALKFKTQRHLAFITQDRGLAEDLQSIAYFRSLNDHWGHPKYDIKIRRISKSGKLVPFNGLEAAIAERYREVAEGVNAKELNERRGSEKRNRNPKSRDSSAQASSAPKKNWWEA